MTTINDLLAQLGVEDDATVKTAAAKSQPDSEKEIEKAAEELGLFSTSEQESTTKTASQTGGPNMNLQDLYNNYFGDGEATTEKIASQAQENISEEDMEKIAAAELEAAGERAGRVFSDGLDERLMKLAMDMVQDSEATQQRNQTTGVIPGAQVAQPQLEVNRPADASKAMDLTPQYYDMLDKAVAKKAIEKALAEGKPGELSHKVVSVDTGLEMPTDQKDA